MSKFRFSRDGKFSDNADTWLRHCAHLRGHAFGCLEIGCLEGESTTWMLEHLLTHPDARIVCVDPWPDPRIEETFDFNIRQSGRGDQVVKIKGRSQELLPGMSDRFQLAYIDGSHEARDVMADAVNVWRMLSPDGIVIFDDYAWYGSDVRVQPAVAIDTFLSMWAAEMDVLHVEWQVIVKRVSPPRF